MKINQYYVFVCITLPVANFAFITSPFHVGPFRPLQKPRRIPTSSSTTNNVYNSSTPPNVGAGANDKVLPLEIEHELKESFMRYALSTIMGRALPDMRDGLKPVHRRILYAMNVLGLKPSGGYRKCARVVGEVLGKFHPHGDSSVYDALVRMSQDFVMSKTLIAGHGNFGSQDNDPPAAMRYTECKLSELAHQSLLQDMTLNTVDFIPNFDGNEMEPVILPARFPLLLLNGASGIAVGMATNIPPHNFNELATAIEAMVDLRINDQPEISTEELYKIIPAPDFPTGGTIMGVAPSKELYDTGRGSIKLRAKTKFETIKIKTNSGKIVTKQAIIVTEVPYLCNKAALLERIAELVNEKKIMGISDLRDESDREGVRIVIELKKDAMPYVVLNNLYLKTGLQSAFSGNFFALSKRGTSPHRFTLLGALQEFLDFRLSVVRRRAKHRLEADGMRKHVVDGLLIAIKRIDHVIEIIRKESDRSNAKRALMALRPQALSQNQSEAVLNLQLGRLTSLDQQNLENEKMNLESHIEYLKTVLNEDCKVAWQEIRNETIELKKKFGTPRKTAIEPNDGILNDEDLIENERSVVVVSKRGYIKRMTLDTGAFAKVQRINTRGVVGVNFAYTGNAIKSSTGDGEDEEDGDLMAGLQVDENENQISPLLSGGTSEPGDEVDHFFTCNDLDSVLFVSSKGHVYAVKAWQIPIASRLSRGTPLPSLITTKKGTHMAAVLPITFSNNHVCNKDAKEETDIQQQDDDDDDVHDDGDDVDDDDDIDGDDDFVDGDDVDGDIDDGEEALILLTKKGRIKKIPLSVFSQAHKRKNGVRSIKILPGDDLKWVRTSKSQSDSIVLATKLGFGARFSLNHREVRIQKLKTSTGVTAMRLRKGDEIVDIDVLRNIGEEGDQADTMIDENTKKTDILVLTSNGYGKRIKLKEFATTHRNMLGFPVIKFKDKLLFKKNKSKDTIACLRACSPHDDVLLSTSTGIIVRQKVSNIPVKPRMGPGVMTQKLDEGATISKVAVVSTNRTNSSPSILHPFLRMKKK